MASGLQKGASEAGAGAGIGATVGGPYGAAIGGGIGFLAGLFSGSDTTPQAPLFSDVNLAKDNPTLYAQLERQQGMVDQLQSLYNQRSQGMTPSEQEQFQHEQSQLAGSLGARGMAGTSAGAAAAYGGAIQNQNNIADRIKQQQMSIASQMQQAQAGLTGATQSGLQQTYGAQMVPYEQKLGELGNSNALNNGLLQGGLSLFGQANNTNKLNGMVDNGSGGMLPNGYSMGQGGIQFNGGMNPYGGGYAAPGTSFGAMPLPTMMPQQQNYGYSLNPAYQ